MSKKKKTRPKKKRHSRRATPKATTSIPFYHAWVKNALYQCDACAHQYVLYPGPAGDLIKAVPGARESNVCPKCGSLWVTWLNYIQDFQPSNYLVDREESS